MGSFGEKLRKQREVSGLTLQAISNTTKISTRMLRAIEEEHFDQLPGGVFNKGFVRAYARQVGLDEEEAVTDYLAALRETQLHSQILPDFRNPERNGSDQNRPGQNRLGQNRLDQNSLGPDTLHPNQDLAANHSSARGIPALSRPPLPSGSVPRNDLAESPVTDRRVEGRRKDARRTDDGELGPLRAEARKTHDRSAEKTLGTDGASAAPLSFLNLDSAPSSATPANGKSDRFPSAAPVPANHSSGRVRWEKLTISLLVITIVLVFWAFHRRTQSVTASRSAAPQPSVAPAPVIGSSSAVLSPASNTTPAAHPREAAPVLARSVPAQSTPAQSTPAQSAPLQSVPAQSTPILAAAKVNLPAPKPHAQAVQPSPKFTLLIRAAQTSWVSIAADGQPAARETLIAPANTSVRASHEIVVQAGDGAAVSFLLNGKEIRSEGSPGEARAYTFDASGLRASYALPAANEVR